MKGIKTGGRRSGTPNRTTKEIRELITDLLNKNLDKVDECLSHVAENNPEKFLDIIFKISEFVVPKLQRQEIAHDEGEPVYNVINLGQGIPSPVITAINKAEQDKIKELLEKFDTK